MTADTPNPAPDDVVELLGLVAYMALAVFGQVALDASRAPTLRARQRISEVAAAVLGRQVCVRDRVQELGADPDARMSVFDGVLDDFDARTKPSTWWEGRLKGYVGHAITEDFCRIAARGLVGADQELVVATFSMVEDERVADEMARAAASDPVLASRLALWGRRLAGEALKVTQSLLADRPAMARLIAAGERRGRADAGAAGSTDGSDERGGGSTGAAGPHGRQWVFGRLTAEHTRRMARLGLAA